MLGEINLGNLWIITVIVQPYLSNLQQESVVQALQFVHHNQGPHRIRGFVELICRDTEPDTVVPDLPVPSIDLECLLSACQGLFEFVLHGIAISNVTPSISLVFIYGHHISKGKDGLLHLL